MKCVTDLPVGPWYPSLHCAGRDPVGRANGIRHRKTSIHIRAQRCSSGMAVRRACATASFGTSGFAFGGTLGANYQVGALVFGVEADGDWTDVGGFGTFTATSSTSFCAGGCLTKNSWLSTARGRVGYAFDRASSSTAPAAPPSAMSKPASPMMPLAVRLKPAGQSAPAWKLPSPRTGRLRPNTSSSTFPTGRVRQIA